MQDTALTLGNGTREKIGEHGAMIEMLLREIDRLQTNHRELQAAFAEVAGEFAQHVSAHHETERARVNAEQERAKREQIQIDAKRFNWTALLSIVSCLIAAGAIVTTWVR